MGRERRDFSRPGGFRDANLFVIATEGAVTEVGYFQGIKERYHSPRIHIKILDRDKVGESSPVAVLDSLKKFSRYYSLRSGDQLWLVIDRDQQSWEVRMHSQVADECRKHDYMLAVSNPCFELWLWLHFEDVENQDDSRKQSLLENRNGMLKTLVATKKKPYQDPIEPYYPTTLIAIERARALDKNPGERWPSRLGTRVYQLVEQLVRDPKRIKTES